ncbi:hypothetical protein ABFS82_07G082000 [Erythranthe guttata]
MDTTDLPFHIIMVILSMLPVEALAKFQCVCKAWKNIIRDPKFVKDHFQIQAAKGKDYLLYVPLDRTIERAFTLLCDETFDQALEFEIPSEFRDMSFIIIGSCNGVLCFTDANSFGSTVYLCNPSIRKYRTVINPMFDGVELSCQGDVDFALGFGYYEHTNDYLIIRIAILSDEEDEATSKVEVYSMVANSWKNLEVDRFPWERIELKSEAVMRDSVHWKADYRDGDEGIPVILAYRMGEEVFRQIGLPNYKADGKGLVEHIGVYKGNLAMFVFHQSDHFSWHKNCHLWVMNEYGVVSSWTKLYTVVIDAGVVTPIMFTNNDEIIFEDGECDLTVCHFERNTISYLGVEDQGYLNFVTYNGSLVMLED